MAATGWGRLAKAIVDEAEYLRLTWAALARRSGISPRTLYDLRTGARESYDPEILDRIESGLGWERGSIERVLDGRAPRRVVDPDLARLIAAWRDLPPQVRRVLADVAERFEA